MPDGRDPEGVLRAPNIWSDKNLGHSNVHGTNRSPLAGGNRGDYILENPRLVLAFMGEK